MWNCLEEEFSVRIFELFLILRARLFRRLGTRSVGPKGLCRSGLGLGSEITFKLHISGNEWVVDGAEHDTFVPFVRNQCSDEVKGNGFISSKLDLQFNWQKGEG